MNEIDMDWNGEITIALGEHPFTTQQSIEDLLEAQFMPETDPLNITPQTWDFHSGEIESIISYYPNQIISHPFRKYFSINENGSLLQFSNITLVQELAYIQRILGKLVQKDVSHIVEESPEYGRDHFLLGYNGRTQKRFVSLYLRNNPDLRLLYGSFGSFSVE